MKRSAPSVTRRAERSRRGREDSPRDLPGLHARRMREICYVGFAIFNFRFAIEDGGPAPDILQAEQQFAAATAMIGVAQAQRFPQLALTGAAGGAGFQLNSLSVGPFATVGASASPTGPLLNATALGYQVQVSRGPSQASRRPVPKSDSRCLQGSGRWIDRGAKDARTPGTLRSSKSNPYNLHRTSRPSATREAGPTTSMS